MVSVGDWQGMNKRKRWERKITLLFVQVPLVTLLQKCQIYFVLSYQTKPKNWSTKEAKYISLKDDVLHDFVFKQFGVSLKCAKQ